MKASGYQKKRTEQSEYAILAGVPSEMVATVAPVETARDFHGVKVSPQYDASHLRGRRGECGAWGRESLGGGAFGPTIT